jgi:hypothetical protein
MRLSAEPLTLTRSKRDEAVPGLLTDTTSHATGSSWSKHVGDF